ncbi:DUF6777 domain-containing protein [Streptomyces sp. NPDC059564]|uniref:DUF6777 domain-containing protein n=1 Tax=Streptomyces sp. NPDC059564 TaxID=3346865 RepID=UPI00369E37F5
MKDVNDVPEPTPRQASRRHVPACAALLAVVGLLAAGCGGAGPEQTKGAAAESQELALQPVGAPGPDPFTPSSATAESAPVQPPLPNASGRGIRTVGAATPGLYGGTNRLGSCDIERQVTFLTSDDGKARAFAHATGVEQEKIPEFLRGLTPVVLRADTRITNHAFREGGAAGYQAVLQAGTAVLVDDHGMPRVRCSCGNPLAAPLGAKGSPVLKGDQWNGYQPNQVIVIEPTAQAIKRLVIVNIADNTWIERKAGDDGAQDRVPKVLPPFDPAEGIPNGPATPPEDPDPCAGPDPNSLARTTPPKAPSAPPPAPTPGTPSGPPAGPPADPAAPLDAHGVPLAETAPPLDLPAGPLDDPAPPLDAKGVPLAETAPPAAPPAKPAAPVTPPAGASGLSAARSAGPFGVWAARVAPVTGPPGVPAAPVAPPAGPLDEMAPPLDLQAGSPDEMAPPLDAHGVPLDELAPPLDLPNGPLAEAAPPLGPPAGPPGEAAAPSANPCAPSTGTGTGNGTDTVPSTPSAPSTPQQPPSGGALPPDFPTDQQPLQPPSDPALPPSPDDGRTYDPFVPADPSAPADPFGHPDQQPSTDAGSQLESA